LIASFDFINNQLPIKYNHAIILGSVTRRQHTVDTTMQVTPAESAQLVNSLKKCLTGEAYFDEYLRALYSTDASIYQIMPSTTWPSCPVAAAPAYQGSRSARG
jgi:hypothetical protein